mmetsp:Transcript_46402/g.84952  ORF Transcript_46402/g.84952 Transcript_46402/m.84952 type:complete len:267 (+) Transcript_46402:836-1636(+)
MQLQCCPQLLVGRERISVGLWKLVCQQLELIRAVEVCNILGCPCLADPEPSTATLLKVVHRIEARIWEGRVPAGYLHKLWQPLFQSHRNRKAVGGCLGGHHLTNADSLPFLLRCHFSNHEEVRLAQLICICPHLCGKVADEVLSHMLGSIESDSIYISISYPEFHEVGVEFLKFLIPCVVVIHTNVKVTKDSARARHAPHLLIGQQPAAVEELLRPEWWKEVLGEVQLSLALQTSTLTTFPMRPVEVCNAHVMVPRACFILRAAIT